jgi:hypothetical protein
MTAKGPDCVKTRASQERAELFSQLRSSKKVVSPIGVHNYEIETKILHASSTSEFLHSLGQGNLILFPH